MKRTLIVMCLAWLASYLMAEKLECIDDQAVDVIAFKSASMEVCTAGVVNDEYLVIGAQTELDEMSNGYLALIPMTEVARLEEKYGNFLKCEGTQHFVGDDDVIDASLIIERDEDYQTLEQLTKMVAVEEKRPIIRLTADRLKMLLIRIRQYTFDPDQVEKMINLYQVGSIEIIEEDYRTPGYEDYKGNRTRKTFSGLRVY